MNGLKITMKTRQAYRNIGEAVQKGSFSFNSDKLHHTHEGSIHNLCLEDIQLAAQKAMGKIMSTNKESE